MRRSEPPRFKVRELEARDLDKGVLSALENLSDMGGLSSADAKGIFRKMKRGNLSHVLVAVVDGGEIAGTTTLLVEQKFIHGGGIVGHIEDVAVGRRFEGQGVGSALVRAGLEKAKELGCYKVILDCKPELVGFYERMGFRKYEIGMRIDLAKS
jgi:glucosamine-phosphate N-acetyltransferase